MDRSLQCNYTSGQLSPIGTGHTFQGYLSHSYSEDCLLLNVWRPVAERTNARSVMFYIYGGGFKTGSIFKLTHDARYIAHRGDVIVVMINYRLGAFGFLYGDDKDAPGNLGLYDQILGLKWVHQNIEHFGGNPNSVTIFGNSAGSTSVGALIVSPLASGLFHRAILQSGVPMQFQSMHKTDSLNHTKSIAKKLNCEASKIGDSVKCLKTKSVEQILNATNDQTFVPVYGEELLPLRPVDALLMTNGTNHANIDLMYGVVKDEAGAIVALSFPQVIDIHYNLTLDTVGQYSGKLIGSQLGKVAAELYFKQVNQTEQLTQKDLRILMTRVISDFSMICPTILFGEQFAKHPLARSNHFYSYMLVQPATVHIAGAPIANLPDWLGVWHADELFLLFTIPKQTKPEDIKLSHQVISAWTNFAKNGDPGMVGNVQWTPALNNLATNNNAESSTSFMALGYNSKMVNNYYRDTCDHFWKSKIFV